LPKLLAIAALFGLGCTGGISEGGPGAGNGGGADPTKPPPGAPGKGGGNGWGNGSTPAPVNPGDPERAVFHRLNRVEYNNTIRELLGDGSRPRRGFPARQELG